MSLSPKLATFRTKNNLQSLKNQFQILPTVILSELILRASKVAFVAFRISMISRVLGLSAVSALLSSISDDSVINIPLSVTSFSRAERAGAAQRVIINQLSATVTTILGMLGVFLTNSLQTDKANAP